MIWTLHLPFDLKSKNAAELAKGPRARAGIYRRLRNMQAHALLIAARDAGIPLARFVGTYDGNPRTEAAPVPFRAIEIVRLMGARQRPFDDDGFIAGAAGLRDACQRERHYRGRYIAGAGLIWDDSAKWSSFTYAQERAADGKPGVRITITENAPGRPASEGER